MTKKGWSQRERETAVERQGGFTCTSTIPLPWQPLSGLRIHVRFFLGLNSARNSLSALGSWYDLGTNLYSSANSDAILAMLRASAFLRQISSMPMQRAHGCVTA
jgi:hypothetical protein